jgi:hypothetical protein
LATALPFLLSSGSDPLSSSSLQLAIALLWVGCRFATEPDEQVFARHGVDYLAVKPIPLVVGDGFPSAARTNDQA